MITQKDYNYNDNIYIKELIERSQNTKPFFIGRVPQVEVNAIVAYKINNIQNDMISDLSNNAGIHTTSLESFKDYVNEYEEAYTKCTAIAIWNKNTVMYNENKYGQEYISQKTPMIPKISALALEPYYYLNKEHNWMSSLKGKSILVIHPFMESMKKQVLHLNNLFNNIPWFEDCTLHFIKPPLTLAGNHENKDWQYHYEKLQNEVNNMYKTTHIDLALVACGGYGMLISSHIHTKLNGSVMYIGGALQIFFGIFGKRWLTNQDILKYITDDWIRPIKTDKPANFTKVEKGCYW
jgi:hypothetical protein